MMDERRYRRARLPYLPQILGGISILCMVLCWILFNLLVGNW